MFEEIQNKELQIEKVSMKADGRLDDEADPLPSPLHTFRSGFNTAIVGFSGSGKTTLLINLLSKNHKKIGKNKVRQSFKKLFSNIFIVSPSLSTLGNNIFDDLPDDQKATELTEQFIDDLYEKLEKIKEDADEVGETHYSLLVLDDVAVSLRKNKKLEQKLVQLFQNRRHLGSGGLSVITLVQSYKNISPQHRNNLNSIFFFKPKVVKERIAIQEDLINLDKKFSIPLFDFVFRNKHDFMFIDFTMSGDSADFDYYRNFNRILFNNKDDEE